MANSDSREQILMTALVQFNKILLDHGRSYNISIKRRDLIEVKKFCSILASSYAKILLF